MNGTERLKKNMKMIGMSSQCNHLLDLRKRRNHRKCQHNHHHVYVTYHLPAAVVVAHVNVHTSTDQLTNGIDIVVVPERTNKEKNNNKKSQE